MNVRTKTDIETSSKAGAQALMSPAELRAVRGEYFSRLTLAEQRILFAFESQLSEDAPQEARMAAFAELRRSPPLRAYLQAAEACRLAEMATALGLTIEADEEAGAEDARDAA